MFVLTDFQRLCLLLGCSGLLGIVIVVTVCVVCSGCWINKRITGKQRKEHDSQMLHIRNSFPMKFSEKEPPPPYDSATRGPFLDGKQPGDFERRLFSVNSISSACSDTESVTGIPLPLISDVDVPIAEDPDNSPFEQGNASISLQFRKITDQDKRVIYQLRVNLKEAAELPTRSYGGRCNPYFAIGLHDAKSYNKQKRRKSLPTPLHEFQSSVVKKSQNPIFNESFFFPFENNNLKKCILRVTAFDQDKLVNDTVLGEAVFHLKDAAASLLQEPPKELDLNLKLGDAKIHHGQLLLGLCYLPTAERMTLAVLKANNLKKANELPEEADFYVQAMAIYAGKIFEKRKTSRRPISQIPVFNEMLMFDVPFTKLDHVVLLVAIYSFLPKSTTSKLEAQPNESNKDICIGKIVIGSSGRKQTLNHWNAMRNCPRRQVIQWHELR